MTSVITGDIIGSRGFESAVWMEGLKQIFNQHGATPQDWEIYRGDEFQIEIKNPAIVLEVSFLIKAYLKTLKLDARMGIGIGTKTYNSKTVTENNGSAFIHSGMVFETLKKEKITLALQSGDADFDANLNLKLRLALTFADSWLVQAAELVLLTIQNPNLSQEELGQLLSINQAAVSRRRKRANFDLILELSDYFQNQLKKLPQ